MYPECVRYYARVDTKEKSVGKAGEAGYKDEEVGVLDPYPEELSDTK